VGLSVEQLYSTYGPMVLRRCRRLLRDEARALDAMQDVFVLVLRNQQRFDQESGSALLFTLATNVCLNLLRTSRRKPEDKDDDVLLAIAQDLDLEQRAQARSVLGRLFDGAPEKTAAIAVMHYLDGMTWEEVAGELKMSVSGVRKRARGITERLSQLKERP
jgi:RNA polymerase sigma-70 factor (ECF subfamily)